MERCFQLAAMGAGNVSPNPMVGAVIVADNKIIGEGYHKKFGYEHAEVNAVNSVVNKDLLQKATVYVSLEPCSHYGKTPPCAELLIKNKIKRCVIANFDPNPKVSGRGIKMLQDAGIEVVCGVEEKQGRFLNRRFFCFQEKRRPYIILKTARSADGYIDINPPKAEKRQKYWITNDAVNVLVHKMRAENDAFMVGANTVINDDCRLNTRYYDGRNPIRLVYDRDLSIPKTKHFFDNTQRTLIFNNLYSSIDNPQEVFQKTMTEYVKIQNEGNRLQEILDFLYTIGVNSLVVEGGKNLSEEFLKKNLWDEVVLFTSNTKFNGGIKAPLFNFECKSTTMYISDNKLDVFYNNSF
ncbi:MAG: bifunctional diaminohydroxyphosphoribosylaminopyrimidine deaminase/5-amino-6-(5-phosphoribosylamino)uracil reductase RibD [Bacteroidales bacterium]|nr:bifunctional diaminohydroxyphosphoribosylaminopyrimidine deaminase/5-amino-6-(5-phosphoribosylamino)uracil reductase RibD [Bacteroidales bacterium]